jgi:hypothetical protein
MAVAEQSITAGGGRISVRQRGSVCPDYLAWATDPTGTLLGLVTVESKGLFSNVARGPAAVALDVLRDATVQTMGLQVGASIPGGYGFCACVVADAPRTPRWGTGMQGLLDGEVIVLGIDPRETSAPLPMAEGPVARLPGGRWAVLDASKFQRSLQESARVQLLLWSGDEDLARRLLHIESPSWLGTGEHATRDDEHGTYFGVELTLRVGDGRGLRIFTGVERKVLGAARDGDYDQLLVARLERRESGRFRADGFRHTETTAPAQDREGSTRAVSVAEDGTRLDAEAISA